MTSLLDKLAGITGAANISDDAADRLLRARRQPFNAIPLPAALPFAVVRPRHMEQLARLVEFCAREGIHMTIHGGGSNLRVSGGAPPAPPLAIVLTGLDRIMDIDRESRICLVQAGVPCSALREAAASSGLYCPSAGIAGLSTIGGQVAANEAGPASLLYGPIGDHLLGLDIVCATGAAFYSPACAAAPGGMAPGLPLARLFCGSMGTLGIVAQIHLRLSPALENVARLAALFQNIPEAASAAQAIVASSLNPSFFEFRAGAPLAPEGCASLRLEFRSSCAEACRQSWLEARELLAAREAQFPEENSEDRSPVELLAATGRPFILEKAACPPASFGALLAGAFEAAGSHGARMAIFAAPALANASFAIFAGPDNQKGLADDIFRLELALNRAAASEEDFALSRSQWESSRKSALDLASGIKRIFDPQGLLPPWDVS